MVRDVLTNISGSHNFPEMAGNYSELDRLNDELAFTLLPVTVIVTVYMAIGIFGNPLVAYYYGFHVKPSPSCYFIVAMAVFDTIVCSVSMPLEIVDMEYPYKFPSKVGCKLFRFMNFFSSLSSVFILVAIATDRYRKVCQPFKTQITTNMTKVIIGIACLISLNVSWPALIFYDVIDVNTTSIPDVVGYDCTTVRNNEFTLYITIFNGVCFLIFLGCITSLTVLYVLIGRKLCLLKRFRVITSRKSSKSAVRTPPTSSINIVSQSKYNEEVLLQPISTTAKYTPIRNKNCNGNDKNKLENVPGNSSNTNNRNVDLSSQTQSNHSENKLETKVTDISTSSSTADKASREVKTKNIDTQQKLKDQYITMKKYTMLMLAITIAFVLSFLPYLGLVTWRTLEQEHEESNMSVSAVVAYNLFIRSWLLSSVVNPMIYGFFNPDFRVFVANIFRGCFHCVTMKREQEKLDGDLTRESSRTA